MSSCAPAIAVACVFNDEEMRTACLDRSINARRQVADIEYLPVDNRSNQFASAGAALNAAAAASDSDYLVLAHQDVYIHDFAALERAAVVLAEGTVGMVGCTGVTSTGRIVGRIRDRVVLDGETVAAPEEVDSLDELLFVVPRQLLRDEPLSEHEGLSWHGYSVEYGARLRRLGLRVAAVDVPVTHNSRTANIAGLDESHAAVAELYPEQSPLWTTCGVVTTSPVARAAHQFRSRATGIASEAVGVLQMHARLGRRRVDTSDVRQSIDARLAGSVPAGHGDSDALSVINHGSGFTVAQGDTPPLRLPRAGRWVRFSTATTQEAITLSEERGPTESLLFTNFPIDDLTDIVRDVPPGELLVGFHRVTQAWAIVGPLASRRKGSGECPR